MSKLIKPYEISLWEDVYIEGDEDSSPPVDSKYEERKIMVIGSDKMNSSNRVFNPSFTENSNGEKTLEFSIIHNVYNEYTNKKQQNPFIPYLFNERKVKLKYDDEWFDFIIKTSVESSENTFTYTCVDANVLELSKQGYNLELATELKNNQGTVIELGQQVLKDTDWEVDVADCDDIKSYLDEPVYYGEIKEGKTLKVRNMEDFESEPITLNAGTKIYIFYSFIKDKIKKDIQLVLYKEKEKYTFDDNNVAISDNYITTSLNDFAYEGDFPDFFNPLPDSSSSLFTDFQFKRLVRKQKTVYDKITERVVDVYESDKTKSEIYHYIDTVYTTSDILTNYITNGSNFGLSVKDEITGWSGKVIGSGIALTAVPDIADIKEGKGRLGDVRNYLKLKAFENGDYIYNQGIENNGYLIQDFIKGEKYSFRIRAGVEENTSNRRKIIDVGVQLKAVVAGYKIEGSTYTILDDQIFFDFREATHRIDDITIDNGSFNTEKTEYLIDGIPQAPDITVYYKDKDHLDDPLAPYKWSEQDGQYVPHETDDLHFYRMDAECKQPLSDIQNNDIKVGIFIYNTGVKRDYYIESVQLFEYIEDANDVPMVIGNIPEGAIKEKELFYLKPSDTAKKEDIPFFNSQDAIEASIVESIKPKIDEKCLAVSMIEAKDSNYFDILQSLCERFECWLKFNIEREEIFFETSDTEINFEKEYYKLEEGNYIKVENPLEEELPNYYEKELSGRPLSKKIAFKKYIGKDNWAGFKYGINLSEIERTFTSDEIVTKLIVPMSVSEYAKDGFCSIQKANSNISKLGYILNFNYYIERGLLNKKDIENINKFYDKMAQYNDEIFKLEEELSNIELKITILDGKRTVFDEYVENAKEALTKAYEAFDTITGFPYTDAYDISQLPDKYDSLVEVTTQIAFNKNIINTYEPLAQKISEECGELEIKAHGCLPHVLTIDKVDDIYRWYLDDYVKGIEFDLEDSGGTIKNFVTTYFSKGEKLEQDFVPARIENIIFPKEYKPIGENPDYNPEIGDLSNRDYTLNIIPIDELSSETSLEKRIEKKREERDEEEKKFLKKYGPFIQEGTWNSDDYIDDELYYLDAVKAAYQNGKPKVEYSIKVIEVSQLEGLSGYNFRIGDKTYIEDTEFFGWITIDEVPTPIKEEVVISEFIHNLDDPTEDSITVKNYKTNFEDLFQRLAATTQTIQYNQGSYARAASAIDASGIINPQVLLNSIQGLGGQPYTLTTNRIITVVSDGIVATDILDENRKIKLTSGAISTTTDNGENWLNVLTPDGLNAEFLRAGKINTDEITLGSKDNPSFRWDSSGLNAYRNDGTNYNLNKFVRLDQYGLYGIDGDEFFKPTNINEIEENAKFGLTWKGFFLNSDHGAVKISNEKDIQVFNGDDKVKIHIGRIEEEPEEKYGIRINDNDENLVLETDDDGDLALAGLLSSISYKGNPSIGWAINGDGDAVFNNITARGAIKTAVFEYAEIQAVGGVFLFRPSSTIKSAKRGEGEGINNIIVTVDKPALFRNGQWCKISNYYSGDNDPDIEDGTGKIIQNNGLLNIYEISRTEGSEEITLIGAAEMIGEEDKPIKDVEELIGGALVDMGNTNKTSNYGIGINSSDNNVALPARTISLFETTIHPDATTKITYDYQGILGTLPTLPTNKVSPIYSAYMKDKQGIFTNNMYIGDKDQYIAFYKDANGDSQLRLVAKSFEILPDDSDLPIDLGDSVIEQKIQYTLSTSTEENTVEEEWRDTPYEESSGYYLWQRTYVKYAKGRVQYLPTEDGYYMSAGQPGPAGPTGPAGEDAVNLVIDSSNGNTFKNSSVNTVLSVTIYKGTIIINDIVHLKEIFGNTAYLQWYWKRMGESDFHPISIDDSMLSNGGFNLTLTPDKVDVKVVFQCEIITTEN